ncbi:hypothetical protein T492DRAFT_347710 [Pavlovales sp. CCMP2436]|nr:hypothetical protein T492DRAFT_347710 [Pavlovales sp. CCMP2436]
MAQQTMPLVSKQPQQQPMAQQTMLLPQQQRPQQPQQQPPPQQQRPMAQQQPVKQPQQRLAQQTMPQPQQRPPQPQQPRAMAKPVRRYAACSLDKLLECFSKAQLRREPDRTRCRACVEAEPSMRRCAACSKEKGLTYFSELQREPDATRCKVCVEACIYLLAAPLAVVPAAIDGAQLSVRRCAACSEEKELECFSAAQLGRKPGGTRCRACIDARIYLPAASSAVAQAAAVAPIAAAAQLISLRSELEVLRRLAGVEADARAELQQQLARVEAEV